MFCRGKLFDGRFCLEQVLSNEIVCNHFQETRPKEGARHVGCRNVYQKHDKVQHDGAKTTGFLQARPFAPLNYLF